MLTPRPCWVRAWACSLGYAPVRMELTPSANKVLSFCANVDMELCLGSEKRSPAWLQISLSVFFCLVHLHRFKGVDGGAGERWWELRIFSPRNSPQGAKTWECLLQRWRCPLVIVVSVGQEKDQMGRWQRTDPSPFPPVPGWM